jgi:hypothetical protein
MFASSMMNSDLAVDAARLSGYLHGLTSVDGDIRQYTAEAHVISRKNSADSPEVMIRNFYAAQTVVQFSSSRKLERGLGDLERELRAYLIRRPWGLVEQTIAQQSIDDRGRFLAFRIMDMISDIAPEAYKLCSVYKVETSGSDSQSQVTFFCVGIDVGFLVLQFNDNSLRIRADRT